MAIKTAMRGLFAGHEVALSPSLEMEQGQMGTIQRRAVRSAADLTSLQVAGRAFPSPSRAIRPCQARHPPASHHATRGANLIVRLGQLTVQPLLEAGEERVACSASHTSSQRQTRTAAVHLLYEPWARSRIKHSIVHGKTATPPQCAGLLSGCWLWGCKIRVLWAGFDS